MRKYFKIFALVALLGLSGLLSGGCGGSDDADTNDTDNPGTSYAIVNAAGAVLPADQASWTTEEKTAWVSQATLLLNQMSDPKFRGRMTGDIGYKDAAYWAAASFKDWGLEPLAGSYFQDFQTSYSMPTVSPTISILVDGQVWKSTANGDYLDDEFVKDVLAAHGTNTGTARGKVTFLGYGIDATAANTYANSEFSRINPATVYRSDFNEYVGLTWAAGADPATAAPTKTALDVANRVVIVRNATPNGLSNVDYRPTPILGGALQPAEYKYTVGNDWIRHDEHYVKIAVARQRNAAGLLYNQMVANPNIRFQPSVGSTPFQIAMVGNIGLNTADGTKDEEYYSNGTGESRLLNDLFAKQLELEAASNGASHTLTDLIARARTVKEPAEGGDGAPRAVPMRDFGDGRGQVPDYPGFLYLATQDLFRGPESTVGAANSAYDKNYDASIATNSFHFDDRIEIEITSVAETYENVRGMNVVGVIPGSEFPNEYVVYMTHYDHCGFVGKYICTGAADNGAGSAANMIAARYAALRAAAGDRPKRTLVFVLDGSEESGMNGAKTAAAWFAEQGTANVKAVFHTDSGLGRGNGNITVSANMSTSLEPLINLMLNSEQGRNHPWGTSAAGLGESNSDAAISMGTPVTRPGNDNYVGRPRTDVAAWMDAGMPVLINVAASQVNGISPLYHAPYNDRTYVGDHLAALLGIATANNMYTAANR